jgi:hypothetical protein
MPSGSVGTEVLSLKDTEKFLRRGAGLTNSARIVSYPIFGIIVRDSFWIRNISTMADWTNSICGWPLA